MSIFSHQSRRYSKTTRSPHVVSKAGFTLIELLVVMAIMVLVTGVMLVRQAKFDSSTILRSLAYSVGLSLRQAQVYGTSVLGTTTSQVACGVGNYYSGNCYAPAYGIYFDTTTPTQYILFADFNGDSKYTANEGVKTFYLNNGYTLGQFCVSGTNGGSPVQRCSPSTISSLTVVFKRPNPDAFYVALDAVGAPISGDINYSTATIQILNQGDPGTIRSATVTNTGLISAQ